MQLVWRDHIPEPFAVVEPDFDNVVVRIDVVNPGLPATDAEARDWTAVGGRRRAGGIARGAEEPAVIPAQFHHMVLLVEVIHAGTGAADPKARQGAAGSRRRRFGSRSGVPKKPPI